MAPRKPDKPRAPAGPTQRQLRAGELVRHALVDIFREVTINDTVLAGVSVTVAEVRMGPDLRHATIFAEPLGGENHEAVIKALNRHKSFIRGHLGRAIELRFTPELHFRHDDSFLEAQRIEKLFDDPRVRQDLTPDEPSDSWKDAD